MKKLKILKYEWHFSGPIHYRAELITESLIPRGFSLINDTNTEKTYPIEQQIANVNYLVKLFCELE